MFSLRRSSEYAVTLPTAVKSPLSSNVYFVVVPSRIIKLLIPDCKSKNKSEPSVKILASLSFPNTISLLSPNFKSDAAVPPIDTSKLSRALSSSLRASTSDDFVVVFKEAKLPTLLSTSLIAPVIDWLVVANGITAPVESVSVILGEVESPIPEALKAESRSLKELSRTLKLLSRTLKLLSVVL